MFHPHPSRVTFLLLLLLWLAPTTFSWAAPQRAILLIWDSKDRNAAEAHAEMVEEIKRVRAQGLLAKVGDVDNRIKVYDFAIAAHAQSLKALGLTREQHLPALAAVHINSQGLPTKVLYVTRYRRPAEAVDGLGQYLGVDLKGTAVTPGGPEQRRLVFVTDGQNQQIASERLRGYVSSHFKELAGVPDLSNKVFSYTFERDDHRQFLEKLGLERSHAPYLTVIRFVGEAPRDVLWSVPVADNESAWEALCVYLGMKGGAAVDKAIFLIGRPSKEQEPVFNEVRGKLTAVLSEHPPRGVQGVLRESESVPNLRLAGSPPYLVLAKIDGSKAAVSTLSVDSSFTSAEDMIEALYKSLAQVYQPPLKYVNPKDGSVLLRVAGGRYTIGNNQGRDNERPEHLVEMPPYYISKTEVTNEQFAQFVQATGYVTAAERQGSSYTPSGKSYKSVSGLNWKNPNGNGPADRRLPVVHVTHDDALAYAKWAGLTLPYEEQWEYAARGPDHRIFPWGAEFAASNCRCSVGGGLGSAGGPAAVGSFAKDSSPVGCLDMAGNVQEWMVQYYKLYPKGVADTSHCNENYAVVRGGSWANEEPSEFRLSKRLDVPRVASHSALGFRCVRMGRR